MSYSFCTGVRSRCLVELFRKYLFLGPRGSYHWPIFYVQTDPKSEPGKIEDMMKRGVSRGTSKITL